MTGSAVGLSEVRQADDFRRKARMTAIVATVLSVVLPGTGLVYLGQLAAGLAVGMVFAAAANAAAVWGLLAAGAAPAWGLPVAAAAVAAAWLASVAATLYIVARRLPARSAAERDGLFRQGLAAYLRSDLDEAERAFHRILRLCRADVEAHLKLAMVHKARGEAREAVAALRRCRYYDDADAWRWEVERELAQLEHREDRG